MKNTEQVTALVESVLQQLKGYVPKDSTIEFEMSLYPALLVDGSTKVYISRSDRTVAQIQFSVPQKY